MENLKRIVLDTESTGFSPRKGDRIIEIGAIELDSNTSKKNSFHCYLNPEKEMNRHVIKVHGITNEFVADKAKFKDIMHEFINFISGAELIMHNARFDQAFIDNEFYLAGYEKNLEDICEITDTLKIARNLHPGSDNSLDGLCSRYSINEHDRKLHGALLDARILVEVYENMMGEKPHERISSNTYS